MEIRSDSVCARNALRVFCCTSLLLLSLFSLAFPTVQAEAFHARVFPSRIYQGDAFALRVSGLKTTAAPAALLNGKLLRFGSCGKGCFIAIGAVAADTRPGIYQIALTIGAWKRMIGLHVLEGKFQTIQLTLPEEKASPSPEDMGRIIREAALLNEIWEIDSERLWEGAFVFPLKNPLSTLFGTKRVINDKTVSIHRGLDIRGSEGEEIHASNRGRVVLTEELFFGGNTIILDHGDGIYTVYMHLSGFNVSPGDLAEKNAVIGYVGSTGRSSGPHLHFGVKVAGINTNPVALTRLNF
jgi:hypothetical protein